MNARFKLYADLLFVRIRTNFFLVIISAFTVSSGEDCLTLSKVSHLIFNFICMLNWPNCTHYICLYMLG